MPGPASFEEFHWCWHCGYEFSARNAHPPLRSGVESSFSIAAQCVSSSELWIRTNNGYRPPQKSDSCFVSASGVGSGMTGFQTMVSHDSSDGKAERFVMTNNTPRANRPFRSRKALCFVLV